MAFIITSKCLTEVYAACQQVCPVDCMHFVATMPAGYPGEGEAWMAIDQADCIDCGACKPECPIDAIIDSPDQQPDGADWARINQELAPQHRGQRAPARPITEAPRRPNNKLVR
jgi:ferredoxin